MNRKVIGTEVAKKKLYRVRLLDGIRIAETHKGEYIGSEEAAKRLCDEMGIVPECRPGSRVCNFGKSEKDGKWYGWSHRAIYGFGIGDKVKRGDCVANHLPVNFTAKTDTDARMMAIAFAEDVA